MLSIYDIWTAKHVQTYISANNTVVRKLDTRSFIPGIWSIICDYVCEDPKIIDMILRTKWDDFSHGHNMARLFALFPFPGHESFFALELSDALEYHMGHRLYEILLMLPVLTNDGTETAGESPNEQIIALRKKLYDMLYSGTF